MEIVVLNSDIARLVHGYLSKQQLYRASRVFCKTSPHLIQELCAYRHGLQTYNFLPELEEIICEYVKITRTVDRLRGKLPNSRHLPLQSRKVSENVNELSNLVLELLLGSSATATSTSSSNGSSNKTGKENNAKRSALPKKRKLDLYSSDDGRASLASGVKRRRVSDPFCFLDSNQTARKKARRVKLTSSYVNYNDGASTVSDDTEEEEDDDGDEPAEADEDDDDGKQEEDGEGKERTIRTATKRVPSRQTRRPKDGDSDGEPHLARKPTDESTPRPRKTSKALYATPTMPEISQAILDDREFQMRLVNNINQALNISHIAPELDAATLETAPTLGGVTATTSTGAAKFGEPLVVSEDQQVISSNQMLDQMVKDILAATESDPAFDKIIENVVGSSNSASKCVSASVQCNMDAPLPQPPPTISAPASLLLDVQQQQQLVLPLNDAAGNAPRTPLIIRTAAAGTASYCNANNNNNEPQFAPTLAMANSSFGSLMDPNYSISKLIVLNSNDSAQKQPPLGNTTAESILSELPTDCGVPPISDDQVCFDASTGQLTFPLFLTSDGLLTNFPFLISNELLTQQLQSDCLLNADSSRIEIPLAKPIVVSADQLPPNAIIFGSSQKNPPVIGSGVEEIGTAKAATGVKGIGTAAHQYPASVDPAALDQRLLADRATPSSSGIVNGKAFRSLSTPRKRAPHVRTLTFSPKGGGAAGALSWMGITPVSTRKEALTRLRSMAPHTTIAEDDEAARDGCDVVAKEVTIAATPLLPEKPIIKNVEILPRLAAGVIDTSANESSNSCSAVPPLFATGDGANESSNQTIIKREPGSSKVLPVKAKAATKGIALRPIAPAPSSVSEATRGCAARLLTSHSHTPKRKQQRRKAVRACKRQLSKSSNEEEAENENAVAADNKQPVDANEKAVEEVVEVAIKLPMTAIEKEVPAKATEQEPTAVVSPPPLTDQSESNVAKPEKIELDPMLAEWKRMRNSNTQNLETRLREMNAKIWEERPHAKHPAKRRTKRKRNADKSMKRKKNSSMNKSSEGEEDQTDEKVERKTKEQPNTSKQRTKKLKVEVKVKPRANAAATAKKKPITAEKIKKNESAVRGQAKPANKLTETQTKQADNIEEAKCPATKSQEAQLPAANSNKEQLQTAAPPVPDISITSGSLAAAKAAMNLSPPEHSLARLVDSEREKRTVNIACLLDTPFKDITISKTATTTTTLMTDDDRNEFVPEIVPPTPGISLAPCLVETPLPKIKTAGGPASDGHNDTLYSTSYLFGSLTKSELNTPLLSAITPGTRFTPFGSKDAMTPRSAPGTEYSSGGGSSYYRPDESDDLDRNIDHMLHRDTSHKRRLDGEEEVAAAAATLQHMRGQQARLPPPPMVMVTEPVPAGEIVMSEAVDEDILVDAICVEIPVETLRVEPIVLKRIKSFGSADILDAPGAGAGVGSAATAAGLATHIDPHYMLASGLPDISAEEEAGSSSSSPSSSSSSSSSSSNSSSSSSSSSSSDSSPENSPGAGPHRRISANSPSQRMSPRRSGSSLKTPLKASAASGAAREISLENLSEISSAEDEEWNRLAHADADNDSPLVSNAGEVRYPVRSWLTPSKECAAQQAAPIRVTLPLMSAEKRNRAADELEEKRQRMKEKLRQDCQRPLPMRPPHSSAGASHAAPALSAAAANKRLLQAMYTKPAVDVVHAAPPPSPRVAAAPTRLEPLPSVETEEKRPIDVLTALNLSAKKQPTPSTTAAGSAKKVAPPCTIDDNAVSTVFVPAAGAAAAEKLRHGSGKGEIIVPALQTLLTSGTGSSALTTTTNTASVAAANERLGRTPTTTTMAAKKSAIRISAVPPRRTKLTQPISLSPAKKKKTGVRGRPPATKVVVRPAATLASGEATEATKLEIVQTAGASSRLGMTAATVSTAPTNTPAASSTSAARTPSPRIKVRQAQQKGCKIIRARSDSAKATAKTGSVAATLTPAASAKKRVSPRLRKPTPKVALVEKKKKDGEGGCSAAVRRPANKETEVKAKRSATPVEPAAKGVAAMKSKKKDELSSLAKPQTATSSAGLSAKVAVGAAAVAKAEVKDEKDGKGRTTEKPQSEEMRKGAAVKPVQEPVPEMPAEQSNVADKAQQPAMQSDDCNDDGIPDDGTEADDYEEEPCQMTSITEADTRSFLAISYDGPSVSPSASTTPAEGIIKEQPPAGDGVANSSDLQLVIAIEGQPTHYWRCTEEICLFTSDPRPPAAVGTATTTSATTGSQPPIRNIPKKRRIRITATSISEELMQATTTPPPPPPPHPASPARTATTTTEGAILPAATSTPVAEAQRQKKGKTTTVTSSQKAAEEDSATAESLDAAPTTMDSRPTDKIQIEDIESILSHLHPTTTS